MEGLKAPGIIISKTNKLIETLITKRIITTSLLFLTAQHHRKPCRKRERERLGAIVNRGCESGDWRDGGFSGGGLGGDSKFNSGRSGLSFNPQSAFFHLYRDFVLPRLFFSIPLPSRFPFHSPLISLLSILVAFRLEEEK